MHDSFTALGGMIPLINMQLGEIIVGGVGAGLYGMLIFVVIAIFVAGLMVGRTPEYLGKKIEAKEVKMAMLARPLPAARHARLHGRRASCCRPALASIANPGPHGFSEILYAYTSAAANNGSAFAGPHRQHALVQPDARHRHADRAASSSSFRRMAIAGSLAAKKTVPASAGTFPTHGGAVRRPARRRHPDRRRPDLLPGARPRPDRRASRDDRRPDLLDGELNDDHHGDAVPAL